MEEPRPFDPTDQGCELVGCYYCRVFEPEEARRDGDLAARDRVACTRCGGRRRMVNAQMMSADLIAERVNDGADRYDAIAAAGAPAGLERRRAAAEALLGLLLRHGPPAREALLARGSPSLAELRRAYEGLDGAGAPPAAR